LTGRTLVAAVAQVAAERRDPGLKWRRPSLLDQLEYDLFVHLNRRYSVEFATFFSNSTAHYQHFHWRDMDPSFSTSRRMRTLTGQCAQQSFTVTNRWTA